jgi:hypothetical protein
MVSTNVKLTSALIPHGVNVDVMVTVVSGSGVVVAVSVVVVALVVVVVDVVDVVVVDVVVIVVVVIVVVIGALDDGTSSITIFPVHKFITCFRYFPLL